MNNSGRLLFQQGYKQDVRDCIEEIPEEIELSPDELNGVHRTIKLIDGFEQSLKKYFNL